MTETERPVILVIMGSVRMGRRCPEIAGWVMGQAAAHPQARFELVDLRDWPLPPDDEPDIPALGTYQTEHTRAWGQRIAAAKGFVIVTPQYNCGYPAPLKNALDHLYKEWAGKPVAIVTYGGHGGGKCAAQLQEVCAGLKMSVVETLPAITLTQDMIAGGPTGPAHLCAYADILSRALAGLLDRIT